MTKKTFGDIVKVRSDGLEYFVDECHHNNFYRKFDRIDMTPIGRPYWVTVSEGNGSYLNNEVSISQMSEEDNNRFNMSGNNIAYLLITAKDSLGNETELVPGSEKSTDIEIMRSSNNGKPSSYKVRLFSINHSTTNQ